MPRTRLLMALFLLTSLPVISGCDDHNVLSMAEIMQARLEVPVKTKAAKDDKCMALQLVRFRADFDALSDFSRERLLQWVRTNVKTIELQPTEVTEVIEGKVARLILMNGRKQVDTKKLQDALNIRGKSQPTEVAMDDSNLVVTPQASADRSTTIVYTTHDPEMYQAITKVDDWAFKSALQRGSLNFGPPAKAVPLNCGKLAELSQLFAIGGIFSEKDARSGD